ncbi:transposase [Ralstonia pseudosolanacearum]|uniref:transposase n=1 Tax=Ralstonia pseudosolanacearum TaxID=1310165 RepID=UPI003CF475A4
MSFRQNKGDAVPSGNVFKPAAWQQKVVTDIPPIVHALGKATCRTPDELLASRTRFGNPIYAVEDSDDETTWYFSNDLQDAVALGLKWVERGCALKQIPEDQNGEVVYAYSVCGLEEDSDLEFLLYSHYLWRDADSDINEAATPETMTRVRRELFKYVAHWRSYFILLDFSNPASVTAYLEDWENDLLP